MSKMVQIEGVSVEELLEHITVAFQSCTHSINSLGESSDRVAKGMAGIRKTVEDLLVDRKFIKRNLTISDRRISKYERNGVLVAVPNPKDAKATYYRFADFEKVLELEHRRLYPTKQ